MTANKVISQSDYNHETGKRIALKKGQAMDVSGTGRTKKTVKITDDDSLTVVGRGAPILDSSRRNHCYVVSDATYADFLASMKMEPVTVYDYMLDDDAQRGEARNATKELREKIGIGGYQATFVLNPRIESIDAQEYAYQLETYVAVLLSVIFMAASASLQYFRLLNNAKDNLPTAKNLYRFGLSVRQIVGIQRKQMITLFLLPIVFGIVSTFFAMNFLVNMQVTSAYVFVRTAVVLIPLLLLELGYFVRLDRQFEKKMRGYLAVE